MKQLLLLLLVCLPLFSMAQTEMPDTARVAEAKDSSKTTKKREITKMPEFPGGKEALNYYLTKSGKVMVGFVVSRTGKIQDVKIVKGLNRICDKAAIRVVESMPDWTPGQCEGENVSIYLRLPLTFIPLRPY